MAAVILLSGGLDSCVAFELSWRDAVLALTFDYGQRAAAREVEAARAIARRRGVEHLAIELPWLREITRTALCDRGAAIPHPSRAELDSARAHETARLVWVPNRNGVFINVAAAFAESRGADRVIVGFNREEGATFPDNTVEFAAAATGALGFSTLSKVRVESPTATMDKVEIVRRGREVGALIEVAWSCYEGGANPCGTCESCLRRMRAEEHARG